MAKAAPDAVLDKILTEIATASRLTVCAGQPTTYTEAITTFKLADVDVTPGDGNGDFVISNGDVNGRKIRTLAQSAVPIDTGGNADHVALVRVSDTTLIFVTTCTLQALVALGTVDVPFWDVEVSDPA
jgi:hypothetical protein